LGINLECKEIILARQYTLSSTIDKLLLQLKILENKRESLDAVNLFLGILVIGLVIMLVLLIYLLPQFSSIVSIPPLGPIGTGIVLFAYNINLKKNINKEIKQVSEKLSVEYKLAIPQNNTIGETEWKTDKEMHQLSI
jgi:hypothetical protein